MTSLHVIANPQFSFTSFNETHDLSSSPRIKRLNALEEAIQKGALEEIKQQFEQLKFEINEKKIRAKKNLERQKEYCDFLWEHMSILGPLGNAEKGEIEITSTLETIAQIEKETGQQVAVYKNKWLSLLNDPVKFPTGKYGTYARVISTAALANHPGAVILPMQGRSVLMVRIFRHACRGWRYELPRGSGERTDHFAKITALRELKEETGAVVEGDLQLLGTVDSNTGVHVEKEGIPIYLAKIGRLEKHQRDDGEASMTMRFFTKNELEEAIGTGYFTEIMDGQETLTPVRDAFLISALKLYQIYEENIAKHL